jgi:hypothetical protein
VQHGAPEANPVGQRGQQRSGSAAQALLAPPSLRKGVMYACFRS